MKPPTQWIHWLMWLHVAAAVATVVAAAVAAAAVDVAAAVVLSVQIRRVHNSAPLGQWQWQWQLQLHSAVRRQQHRATAYWGLSQLHSNVNQMPQQVANVQPIT